MSWIQEWEDELTGQTPARYNAEFDAILSEEFTGEEA